MCKLDPLTKPEEGQPKPKHAGGRPSKYDPKYCDLAIELGKQGKSREVIACHIGVLHETMLGWAKNYPEFSVALNLAKQYELLWWEDVSQENLATQGFSGAMWSRSMAARLPHKWRENKQIDHGTTDQLADLMRELDGKTARIPFPPVTMGDFGGDGA